MLATSREIEDRALRTVYGELHAGFQSLAAFRKQSRVYERLAAETALDIYVYGDPGWEPPATSSVAYYVEGGGANGAADGDEDEDGAGGTNDARDADGGVDAGATGHELGRFWFVAFDGGESELRTCALLAEEREPGAFYGFWTYDPALVGRLVDYLRRTYPHGEGDGFHESETP